MRNTLLIILALSGSTLLSACHSSINEPAGSSVVISSKYSEVPPRRTMLPIHRTAQQPYEYCHRHKGQVRGHCHH